LSWINYTEVDLDNGNDDKRDSMAIASFMDFGNGLSGHLGFANGSDDRTGVQEIDLNSYGFIKAGPVRSHQRPSGA